MNNRYFGGKFFSQSRQFSIESTWRRGNRTRFGNSVGFGRALFNGRSTQNANFAFVASSVTRVLNSFSLIRFGASIRRDNARNDVFSQTSWSFSAAYQRDFPQGITVIAEPRLFKRSFDERQAAFPTTRLDTLLNASLTFLKRDFRAFGFAPQITLDFARNDSTVDLFRYTRTQVILGATRRF